MSVEGTTFSIACEQCFVFLGILFLENEKNHGKILV
jgi:hypothetical protein